ncbi:tyramine oxidase, partial [Candidatus Saccharibacteria bacterium]|nr:tyramine oxidase [Candidatus Saccharibacteria bacterium]
MVTETLPTTPVGVTHPLDPLTADEISAASQIASSHAPRDGWRFPLVALDEPAKEVVRGFSDGDAIERLALVLLHDITNGDSVECVVDLGSESVVRWTPLEGQQPFPL